MPMKRILSLTFALTVTGVCWVVAASFCLFYYTRYQNTVTELETRINGFDSRLAALEAHKCRELTPVRFWGVISTTDRPMSDAMVLDVSPERRARNIFEAVDSKDGCAITPELRLVLGASTNFECEVQVEDQFGTVADAWLSHAEPYDQLAGLEEFQVDCPNKTNLVRIIARAKPNTSIQMRFEIVVLCQK